jgi:hypothetical protein
VPDNIIFSFFYQIFAEFFVTLSFQLLKDFGIGQRFPFPVLQNLLLTSQRLRVLSGPVDEGGRLHVQDLLQWNEEGWFASGRNAKQFGYGYIVITIRYDLERSKSEIEMNKITLILFFCFYGM